MKKLLSLLLFIALTIGFTGSAFATEPVDVNLVVFSNTETVDNAWRQFVDKASQKFPNYNIVLEMAPANAPEDYIKSRVAAGDFPDVMWVFQTALLIDGGVIQELPKELEDLMLAPEEYKVNDKLYSMPLGKGALGFWYNKGIFAKAGIEALPETWDEFLAACDKIQALGIEPIGMAASEGWYIAGMFNFLWSPATYGAEIHWPSMRNRGEVKFNNPTTLRSLEQFASSKPYWQAGYMSATYDEVKSLFFSEEVAILANGGQYNAGEIDSGEVNVDFEVGYLLPPQDEASMRRVNSFGDNMFVINAEVKDEKLTAVTEVLKYFYSPDCYPDFLSANVLMPAVKGYENEGMSCANPVANTMITELQAAMTTAGTVPHAHAAQGDDAWPSGCREMSEKICQEIAAGNTDYASLMDLMDKQWDLGIDQAAQEK